jgi:lysylphosphatidylglycerol synthetase-like protein (DUF2156 family)
MRKARVTHVASVYRSVTIFKDRHSRQGVLASRMDWLLGTGCAGGDSHHSDDYAFVFTTAPTTRGAPSLIGHLTIASLLVLAFTTLWSYRYTRLAERIADPLRRLSQSTVQRAVWTGVAASALGIVFSMLVMLAEAILLLLYFLRAPQAGVPVIQPAGGGHATWVSALDVMSLLSLNLIAFGEFVVLTLSLWLLFRTTLAYDASTGDVRPTSVTP